MSEQLGKYEGIKPEGLFLLRENKFRDSKEFYEENKEALQRLAITPLRQLAAALAEQMTALDPRMMLESSKMVSRIRRDTRFTKEKYLYRSNLWINFKRRSDTPPPWPWPYMWFEIRPEEDDWSCGVCAYEMSPAYMRFFRERISADSKPFFAALEKAQSLGAQVEFDSYKKDKYPDAPEKLKPWLNAKGFFVMHRAPGLAIVEDDAILAALREQYAAFADMYRWLLAAAEDFLKE